MLKLYGSNISYFTGKMENYFRVREIPYALHSMCFPQTEKLFDQRRSPGRAKGFLVQQPRSRQCTGRWTSQRWRHLKSLTE